MLAEREGQKLLQVARRALEVHFGVSDEREGVYIESPEGVGGVFATLKRSDQLRGCIGYIIPDIELVATTERAVVAAATSDPRFAPVTVGELAEIRISLSVLTRSTPVEDISEIEIGRHGLVIEREGARGLLLPQVATERNWDRERFLAETCVKAGLVPDSWRREETTILRFSAAQFDERSVNNL
jgi:AmmeMemoRadiSam system protein A